METKKQIQEQDTKLPSFSEDTKETFYSTGFELYRNGKYEDAIAFFKMLTLTDPSVRRNWVGLGACQQMIKDYDAAINSYGVAAVLNPDDPFVHYHAADCFFQKGDMTKAIDALSSAIITAKQSKEHLPLVAKLELLHTVWKRELSSEEI